jgi:hypothetical protein
MGTSASFRSPRRDPRWRLVNRSYDGQVPLERVRAELFNAGAGWLAVLSEPSMAGFARAAVRAHAELGDRLAGADDVGHALHEWAATARREAISEGGAAGAAIGERALVTTLLRTLTTSAALDELHGTSAARAWRDARGDPADLAHRYLGAVLEQFTRHVVSRDMGRLVGEGRGARETRELTRTLGRMAGEVADALPAREATTAESWASYLREAFEHGRALPR